MSVFSKIAAALQKTRGSLAAALGGIFSGCPIDDAFYEQLEEALIMADVGVHITGAIIERLRGEVEEQKVREPEQAKALLIEILEEKMRQDTPFQLDGAAVLLIVGVNGVGKTTSIGKLAHYYKEQGRKVLLVAGDTFRAAAGDQLQIWGERAGVPVIKHSEGADPAAVVFDAAAAARARGCDMLICDTAGRLHTKKNLMEELKKIKRVLQRELPGARVETLLVLDAVTGQNALVQAKTFNEAVDITGIVLTKLDGTAKGGMVIAAREQLGIPVRFVGVGEKIDDMVPFDEKAFVQALF